MLRAPKGFTSGGGTALVTSSYRQVIPYLGDPQFSECASCSGRVARLGDREAWHHVNRSIGHVAVVKADRDGWSSWMTGRPWWNAASQRLESTHAE